MLYAMHRSGGPRDPRPATQESGGDSRTLRGVRCEACGHPLAQRSPRCPDCGGILADAAFGPGGVVWSWTTVRVATEGREPPYTLAYIDLDDGPRVLAHVRPVVQVRTGDRVRLVAATTQGDPQVEPAR